MHRLSTSLCFGLYAVASFFIISCSSRSELPPEAGTISQPQPAATTLFQEAQQASAAGQTDKALALYKKITTKYPLSTVGADAQMAHATILDQRKELLEAFDSYQTLINRYPSSSHYSRALNRQETVAMAVADGVIGKKFFGIKSKLAVKKIVGMLTKLRDNAPGSETGAKAQFALGNVYEERKMKSEAIREYEKVIDDYSQTPYAPEAQYRIGKILMGQTQSGNRDQANLDAARRAFEDLVQIYPDTPQAEKGRAQLKQLLSRDLQRSISVADFYYDKKQYQSAEFYYRQVLTKTTAGATHDRAVKRLAEIKAQKE